MEFIGGITLQQYLTQHPKLSHLQCRAIIFVSYYGEKATSQSSQLSP